MIVAENAKFTSGEFAFVHLDVEKLGIQDKKATYDEIKAYVSEKYGYKIPSLYIAQVKERAGIQKRENYNIGEGKGVVPHCPPEKEEAIKDALRHFGMIGLNWRRYLRVHMFFLDHIVMGMFGI